jgi:hypothetical protein
VVRQAHHWVGETPAVYAAIGLSLSKDGQNLVSDISLREIPG